MTRALRIAALDPALAPQAAQLHAHAFSGYLSTRLGLRYLLAFLLWFAERDGGIALSALGEHGELLGYIVGAPLPYATAMNRQLFLPAALGLLTHPGLLVDPGAWRALREKARVLAGLKSSSLSADPVLPEPTMSLVAIGVGPLARRRGVGRELMAAFESAALARRLRSMRLSVREDNTAARRFYESLGWSLAGPGGRPGLIYYGKVLA